MKCHQDYKFDLRLAILVAGEYPPVTNNAQFLRRALIQLLGEKCSRCGWNQVHPKTGRVPIEVEHLDGNWENNAVENLTLLCPNCHALTPTFRALNKGRGRSGRWGGRKNPLTQTKRGLKKAAALKQLEVIVLAETRAAASGDNDVQLALLQSRRGHDRHATRAESLAAEVLSTDDVQLPLLTAPA